MIDFTYAKCDRCAKKINFQGRMSFHGIVAKIKELGWRITKKADGGWGHYCPECTTAYKERRAAPPVRPATPREPGRQWWQD